MRLRIVRWNIKNVLRLIARPRMRVSTVPGVDNRSTRNAQERRCVTV